MFLILNKLAAVCWLSILLCWLIGLKTLQLVSASYLLCSHAFSYFGRKENCPDGFLPHFALALSRSVLLAPPHLAGTFTCVLCSSTPSKKKTLKRTTEFWMTSSGFEFLPNSRLSKREIFHSTFVALCPCMRSMKKSSSLLSQDQNK